ncbi:MAG TPA: zinc ribbon domain-containing protein [Gemmatimonas sp.]|nr:zinc ribbon domain-containing protein [Gemmatimonas sp.]
MIKSLRVPERLFAIAMWVVSLAFAGFLIGLGGKIIGELPGVDRTLTPEQFMPPGAVRATEVRRDSLQRLYQDRSAARDRAQQFLTIASNNYGTARTSFDNWIATRSATTDPRQDPEVLARTRALDSLGAREREREAQREIEALNGAMLEISQAQETENRAEADRSEAVEARYQRALFRQEISIFALRLALTLPLLLIAGFLIARARGSDYWPLARGFVLFAAFAFFVELVPYLPSYGGYVKHGVGILLTAVVARYAVREMKKYLARRRVVEQQSESERRRGMGYETALKRMATHVCPACERPMAGGAASAGNFCVFCGLKLFDECGNCGTRKNAFFQFCPTCGVGTEANGSDARRQATDAGV